MFYMSEVILLYIQHVPILLSLLMNGATAVEYHVNNLLMDLDSIAKVVCVAALPLNRDLLKVEDLNNQAVTVRVILGGTDSGQINVIDVHMSGEQTFLAQVLISFH